MIAALDDDSGAVKHRHSSSGRESYDSTGATINEQDYPMEYDRENASSTDQMTITPFIRWVPRCLRYDRGPSEATGLTLDAYGRGALLMSSIFLGPALLELATEAAHCESEQDCEARVMGMKPSSLLTNIAVVSGIITSCCMPIIGAVVDHTPYRWHVGAYSGFLVSILKGVEIMVSSSTWFYVAWLQVLYGLLFYIHVTATYAYTSELSKDTAEQTTYNTSFFTVLYASALVFMVQMLVYSSILGVGDVGTARISQTITFLTAGFFFSSAWSLFLSHRPPSSTLPTDQTLWTVGFTKIFRTSADIFRTMPALVRLMGSVLFAESASNTLTTIATTYMSTFLDMTSTEIGVVFLVVLVTGIPGAKLGEWLALRFNPLVSTQCCVTLFIVSTTLAGIVLSGPDRKQFAVIFGVLWGLALGWLHPMHTVLFLGLTPDHSRTEFMGIFIFCQQVLSWLPPLVFSTLNELGVGMNIGMISLDIFFVLALMSLKSMGRYDQHTIVAAAAGVPISLSNIQID